MNHLLNDLPYRYTLRAMRLAIFSIFIIIILYPLLSWGQPPSQKGERGGSLVFSSNVYGEIEPCG